jgi:large subunit ribosomal protein L18
MAKSGARQIRHLRVRKKVVGTPERPRLSVFRSLRQIYAQVIDDSTGRTLVAASSLSPAFRQAGGTRGGDVEAARRVGALLGRAAVEKGVRAVVFDRNGYLYHGRVKALAEAVREQGVRI